MSHCLSYLSLYNDNMSTLEKLQEDLTRVENTIQRIEENAQSMSDGSGRSKEEAKLEALERKKNRLEHRIEIAKNNGRVPGSGVIFGGS